MVVVAIITILVSTEIVLYASTFNEFVKAHRAIVTSMQENGVVPFFLEVFHERIKVILSIWRGHKVLFHQRRDAC